MCASSFHRPSTEPTRFAGSCAPKKSMRTIGSLTRCADMIGSRTFDGRIQLLEYLPTILAGPPGANTVSA